MSELVMAMAVFALIGSITPGPVNILAIRRGVVAGRGVALAYVLGASVSYAMVVWLMGKGGQQVLSHPVLVQTARWAGAAYLLYLAWKIAAAQPADLPTAGDASPPSAAGAFLVGCVVQSSNPKAWLVALSGVGLFVLPQRDVSAALGLFCLVSLLACTIGVGCWAVAGRWLARWLGVPARMQLFNRVMGVLLAASVAHMLA